MSAAHTAADGDELFERYLCLEFWGIKPTEKWLEILEKVKKRVIVKECILNGDWKSCPWNVSDDDDQIGSQSSY